MRLATFKTAQGPSYGIVTGKGIVDLKRYIGNQYPDLNFADRAATASPKRRSS